MMQNHGESIKLSRYVPHLRLFEKKRLSLSRLSCSWLPTKCTISFIAGSEPSATLRRRIAVSALRSTGFNGSWLRNVENDHAILSASNLYNILHILHCNTATMKLSVQSQPSLWAKHFTYLYLRKAAVKHSATISNHEQPSCFGPFGPHGWLCSRHRIHRLWRTRWS